MFYTYGPKSNFANCLAQITYSLDQFAKIESKLANMAQQGSLKISFRKQQ